MRNWIAGLILMVAGTAFGQCDALLPGSAPAVYKITFSTGRVVRVSQPQPTPVGASPCQWTSLQTDGAFVVWHTRYIAGLIGAPPYGPFFGVIVISAVRVGIPDGKGNITWRADYTPDPRDGAGPFTVNIGNGVTATVTPG